MKQPKPKNNFAETTQNPAKLIPKLKETTKTYSKGQFPLKHLNCVSERHFLLFFTAHSGNRREFYYIFWK